MAKNDEIRRRLILQSQAKRRASQRSQGSQSISERLRSQAKAKREPGRAYIIHKVPTERPPSLLEQIADLLGALPFGVGGGAGGGGELPQLPEIPAISLGTLGMEVSQRDKENLAEYQKYLKGEPSKLEPAYQKLRDYEAGKGPAPSSSDLAEIARYPPAARTREEYARESSRMEKITGGRTGTVARTLDLALEMEKLPQPIEQEIRRTESQIKSGQIKPEPGAVKISQLFGYGTSEKSRQEQLAQKQAELARTSNERRKQQLNYEIEQIKYETARQQARLQGKEPPARPTMTKTKTTIQPRATKPAPKPAPKPIMKAPLSAPSRSASLPVPKIPKPAPRAPSVPIYMRTPSGAPYMRASSTPKPAQKAAPKPAQKAAPKPAQKAPTRMRPAQAK